MEHRSIARIGVVLGAATLTGTLLGISCSSGKSASAPQGLALLEQDTGVSWASDVDSRYGTTGYLFPEGTPPAIVTPGTDPTSAAMAFFAKYGSIFSMTNPANELAPEYSEDTSASQYASFTQVEGPASVYGSRVNVVFDGSGHISFVIALFVPNLTTFATAAAVSPAQASMTAQADMKQYLPEGQTATLEQTPPAALTIYAPNGSPKLVYVLTISYAIGASSDTVARPRAVMNYLVDAMSGGIIQSSEGAESVYPYPGVASTGHGRGEVTVQG